MKLIKPSFEIIEQQPGLDGLLKHIELCGRTAYKSEDKITAESAPKFVDMIIKRNHTAVLEHGTVYLIIPFERYFYEYEEMGYSHINFKEDENVFITTNYKVLLQNNLLVDLEYQCEPTKFHEKRVTVKFICDRGISHEFVRHRVFSFVQESTRFCNYSLNKFGNELTFIEPCYLNKLCTRFEENNLESGYSNMFTKFDYLNILEYLENCYIAAITAGLKPQEARMILPNSLKTELIMTGTIDQWKGFFKLRCAEDAHPQARELAIPLQERFKKLNYI
jgi:thymidylate synthase (FAD)